jgi:DNA processing protein
MDRRDRDRDLLIALTTNLGLQRAAVCRLGATLELWRASAQPQLELARELGVPSGQLRRALTLTADATERARRAEAAAENAGCRFVTRLDAEYPAALFDHPLPPPCLIVRGELPSHRAVAVVGARRMDSYGREVTRFFAERLARAGLTVVSGFARGVDETAHRAALDAGGTTVAVLGCGLDIDYPKGSRALAEAISRQGALITELPFGTAPRAFSFPIRNRLIAALGEATLVVQARLRSGSLNTAHQSVELGREVFAVPGRIFDELSQGTNQLIGEGATPALTPDDVLEHLGQEPGHPLGPRPAPVQPSPALEGLSGRIFAALPQSEPRSAENLAFDLGTSVDLVLGALLELEILGLADRRPGPVYGRIG